MSLVWVLCFGQLWAVAADVLYVQPRRRLSAARRGVDYQPGPLSFALRASWPIVVGVLLVRAFLLDVYHVPTASMFPALQPGDRIWVNRLAYGLRWPLSGARLGGGAAPPHRGERVVFLDPRNPATVVVKRVLAVPGDRVRIDDRRIEVNGRPLVGTWTPSAEAAIQWAELDGTRFAVRADFSHAARPVQLDVVVPAGHLFMLGDNLDHSDDSRHWGLVADRHLIGRVR